MFAFSPLSILCSSADSEIVMDRTRGEVWTTRRAMQCRHPATVAASVPVWSHHGSESLLNTSFLPPSGSHLQRTFRSLPSMARPRRGEESPSIVPHRNQVAGEMDDHDGFRQAKTTLAGLVSGARPHAEPCPAERHLASHQ